MKSLFDNLSSEVSKMTTRTYSTSFSLGILFINKRLRSAIYAIYGFVRVADEIVDSFEGYNKQKLLAKFKKQAYEAVENKISPNPILNSFQQAISQYNIDLELVEKFFESMEMDLLTNNHTVRSYQKYIFGSAEVVGLMCLYVFVEGNKELYEELEPHARKLGAAFQKVNFLRDLKEDYHFLGRVYFPHIDMTDFSDHSKKKIEAEIEKDFKEAFIGIKKLPPSSKKGVYLAYITYLALFNKIKKLPAERMLQERVRINNGKKAGIILNGIIQHKLKLI
jgi:phytoene/squalene synthetase